MVLGCTSCAALQQQHNCHDGKATAPHQYKHHGKPVFFYSHKAIEHFADSLYNREKHSSNLVTYMVKYGCLAGNIRVALFEAPMRRVAHLCLLTPLILHSG